jgi:hypothetical protein
MGSDCRAGVAMKCRARFWLAALVSVTLAAGAHLVQGDAGNVVHLNGATGQLYVQQVPIISANSSLGVSTDTAHVILTVNGSGWAPPAGTAGQVPTYQAPTGTVTVTGTGTTTHTASATQTGTSTNLQPAAIPTPAPITGITGQVAYFGGSATGTATATLVGVTAPTWPGRFLARTVLTTTATATGTSVSYTPTTGTTTEIVEVLAAGGGGGGCVGPNTGTTFCVGGGGAGGEYLSFVVTGASIPTGWYYYAGKGGAGGSTAGATGSTGGNSYVIMYSTAHRANGGLGGTGCSSAVSHGIYLGGVGQSGSEGTVDWSAIGQPGGWGLMESTQAIRALSGAGASSTFGAGGAALLIEDSTVGNAASGHGSGGGGCVGNITAKAGGAGANGMIIVWDFS